MVRVIQSVGALAVLCWVVLGLLYVFGGWSQETVMNSALQLTMGLGVLFVAGVAFKWLGSAGPKGDPSDSHSSQKDLGKM